MSFLPGSPGGYILELFLAQPVTLQVGHLGEFTFPAVAYLYFGSACGPGGLRARLTRHMLPSSTHPLHWHIDYLRVVAELRAFGYLVGSCQEQAALRLECHWSQAITRLPGSRVPVPGFGASDCHLGCPAHLLAIQEPCVAKRPVLLDPTLQNYLANAAGLAKTENKMRWFEIGQSNNPCMR
jgi:Uri superfamily endonuclease